jgi:hypothetical protein
MNVWPAEENYVDSDLYPKRSSFYSFFLSLISVFFLFIDLIPSPLQR